MMRAVGEARGVRAVYFNLCKLLHAHVTIVPFCGGARETLPSRGSACRAVQNLVYARDRGAYPRASSRPMCRVVTDE